MTFAPSFTMPTTQEFIKRSLFPFLAILAVFSIPAIAATGEEAKSSQA